MFTPIAGGAVAPESHRGAGTLFICATPIGNLDDATPRLIDTLSRVDTILAEDTRVTAKLCARFGVTTSLERCDDNVIRTKTPSIIERLKGGENIALASDAGTPGISDPGQSLIEAARTEDIPVEVIPGPAALIVALTLSGLPSDRFYFGGFLPRKATEKDRALEALKDLPATLVFYESPHRTIDSLDAFCKAFPGRACAVARELTKLHEEIVRGTVEEVRDQVSARGSLKGEIVLLVGPPIGPTQDDLEARERMIANRRDGLLADGIPKSEIVRILVCEFDIPRNQAYDLVHLV